MQTIDVVAAIIVRDGALLATQRAKGAFAGGWEFPGGKIEPGETPEQALVREIAEELGVAIAVDRHVVTIERDYEAVDKHIHLLCFACHLVEGKLELREHSAFRWLRENELYTVEWLPADIAVLDAILAQGVLDSKSEKKRKISERSY